MSEDLEKELVFSVDEQVRKKFKNLENTEKLTEETQSVDDVHAYNPNSKITNKIIFFDYKTDFFSDLQKEVSTDFESVIIKDFENLPPELHGADKTILFLNYTAYPRLCQQMIPQIKSKFSAVIIVLVAKNLTAEKVQKHRDSVYGVHDYLSDPFTRDDFFRILMKYN
jgi:superfamily II helicase